MICQVVYYCVDSYMNVYICFKLVFMEEYLGIKFYNEFVWVEFVDSQLLLEFLLILLEGLY